MEVALIVAIAAALVGLRKGGSLHALAYTHFRAPLLLLAGLVLQLGLNLWEPEWLTDDLALALLLSSNAIVASFIAVNQKLPGMLLIAMGLALNVAVITANRAMPVSAQAAEQSGATTVVGDAGIKHEALDEDTVLPWLGDVIPVPGLRLVLSVGDLLLDAGMSKLLYVRTLSGRPNRPASRTASG